MRSPRAVALAGAATVAACLLAGCTGDGEPDPTPTPTVAPGPLVVGVYGPEDEVAAFQQVVDTWNADNPDHQVALTAVADEAAQGELLRSGERVPDVFLLARRDLSYVMTAELTQPVGQLLDQPSRDVDFGDGYAIDAVRAFAGDDELQCMPYGYSPMVMYYNTRLIDFTRMERRGLLVPSEPGRWRFEEFAEAARFAARPATRSAGVHIDPSIRGLAPFIYAGGGQVFDDEEAPTSLTFSDDDSQAALATILELLRTPPAVTLSDRQLAAKEPLEWFKEGRLGMIAGFRSLTPELRAVRGLDFDVMAMPSLGDQQTVGDVTGLCISSEVAVPEEAADFIYYLSGEEAVSAVAQKGYLVPANLEVAASDAFIQPGNEPVTALVFNETIRDIVLSPVIDVYTELDAAVSVNIQRLFSMGALDLPGVTADIDADSGVVLNPPDPSESPSP